MRAELDQLLSQRYPLIFTNRHCSIDDSCMARGFECGDGWFDILDALCERAQFLIDHNPIPQMVARQVKEKMGTLRFYISGGNDEIRGMISMAEAMSSRVCELCGRPGRLAAHAGMTRCHAHAGIIEQNDC